MSSAMIIANTITFVVWIYFQRARDDDESLARIIIRDSPTVTGFAETKTKGERKCPVTRWEAFITGSEGGGAIAMYSKVSSNDEGIRSIRWFQPVAKRRWCPEESNAAVSWRKNYSDGWPEVRASRSVIARARGAVEDITLDGEFVTHELALGVKLCRKKSESIFFPLSLMTTNASTDDCVRFIARVERAGRQSRKALFFFFLWRAEEMVLIKIQSQIAQITSVQDWKYCSLWTSIYYLIWIENHVFFPLTLYHSCVCFIKGYLSCVTLSHFFYIMYFVWWLNLFC